MIPLSTHRSSTRGLPRDFGKKGRSRSIYLSASQKCPLIVRTRANIPNRLGASVRYDGIPGAIFAAGVEQQDWSRMGSLGSALVETRDATNFHAGAEVSGPRLMGSVMQLRAGYARNALPFGVSGRTVSETRLTTGFGLPFARETLRRFHHLALGKVPGNDPPVKGRYHGDMRPNCVVAV